MTQLEGLLLHSNLLSGPIPLEIANLSQLRTFAVTSNFLTGKIPDLSSLTSLEYLSMSDNYYIGETFPNVTASNNLGKHAYLSDSDETPM